MTKMIYKVVSILVLTTSLVFSMSVSKLNVASKSELLKIKGIGDKKADAIIKYRRDKPFIKISDVEEVKGVGSALAKNIKNDVLSGVKKKTKKTVKTKKAKDETKKAKSVKKKTKKDDKLKKDDKKS